ncbi:MAG: GINS complex subunit 4 [Bacillariaceae sp.]|jgi:GINS complex subunit 4
MADLYHLLDELEENEAADEAGGVNKQQDDRRLTVETAVTETLSDDDDYDDDIATPASMQPRVPAALQEAVREKERGMYNDNDTYNDDDFALEKNLFKKNGMDIMDDDDDVQDDEQQNISNELYEKLHQLWLQERHCPELLKYDEDMVQGLLRSFEEREEMIDESSDSHNAVELLMSNLQQQDLDRARFVLSDWLTHRLQKIESHPLHMRIKLDDMSRNEVEYLSAYGAMMENHLNSTVLDTIPEAWQALDDPDMIDQPEYDGYHFWLVKDTIVDKDEIDHETGSCLVAKYLDMKDNMKENKVELLI